MERQNDAYRILRNSNKIQFWMKQNMILHPKSFNTKFINSIRKYILSIDWEGIIERQILLGKWFIKTNSDISTAEWEAEAQLTRHFPGAEERELAGDEVALHQERRLHSWIRVWSLQVGHFIFYFKWGCFELLRVGKARIMSREIGSM